VPQKGSSRANTTERVDRVEEMLATGLSSEFIQRLLSGPADYDEKGRNVGGYSVSRRMVRKYITMVYERWDEQKPQNDPHRREQLIRMAFRNHARAQAAGDYHAANGAIRNLMQMTGVLSQADPAREAAIKALGPAPEDPALMTLYAQRCMVLELTHVISARAIDPEKRLRWIVDISTRLSAFHQKSLASQRIEELERQLSSIAPVDPAAQIDEETERAMQELARRLAESIGQATNGNGGNGHALPPGITIEGDDDGEDD
jgi:hypothetical protein